MGKHAADYVISSRQMLPVFRVLSNLEDPSFTNRSLALAHYDRGANRDRQGQEYLMDYRAKKSNPKGLNSNKKAKSRRSHPKFSPEKLNFAANFTRTEKVFDVSVPTKRIGLFTSMHEDIFSRRDSKDKKSMDDFELIKEKSSNFESMRVHASDNPIYEDPRDAITPVKEKSRSRSVSGSTKKMTKETRALLKEQKQNMMKKYESLIVGLMDRIEDNMVALSEKQAQLLKMKDKLKLLHTYNRQFGEENDRLKRQQINSDAYVEECRRLIRALEGRVAELEAPTKEPSSPVPPEVKLVEVCMSCNTRDILVRQVKEQNDSLHRDMTAMKDVIYRLNMQLSLYQKKLKFVHTNQGMPEEEFANSQPVRNAEQNANNLDETRTKSGAGSQGAEETSNQPDKKSESPTQLDAHSLAPLFEAYQESIQEKDTLILDYEKQFNNFNQRLKLTLQENKSLSDKLAAKSDELISVRDALKRAAAEKENFEADKAIYAERTEKAERKLKDVYELYEDKVAAMARDYETVHREYYTCKTALALAEAKLAQITSGGNRTVPADLHERRIDDCKRLFEELKYQYNNEREKRTDQLNKLQESSSASEAKLKELTAENDKIKTDLKVALKNVRLYRRAAVVFRARLRASVASFNSIRRSRRRTKLIPVPAQTVNGESLKTALEKVDRIKAEIQSVKGTAYRELAEVERRMQVTAREHERDLEKMRLVIEHKESIIRNLIDKVADVEEVRLSEYNSHHLQGYKRSPSKPDPAPVDRRMPDPSQMPSRREDHRRQGSVKLVPALGGYFEECRSRWPSQGKC